MILITLYVVNAKKTDSLCVKKGDL
jgi:hypothetical protein